MLKAIVILLLAAPLFLTFGLCSSLYAQTITWEYWKDVSGNSVNDIPLETKSFSITAVNQFESPENFADNYGSRFRGFITAPQTGNYTFWISGDDNCELYLSTNENIINKVKIAFVSSWTSKREWNKFPEQKSCLISLKAGSKYYIEALHKEGGGGDHLAVGWQLPNGTSERPILGNRLNNYLRPMSNCTDLGGITFKRWNNVSGNLTANIPLNTKPNDSLIISTLEIKNLGDNYGSRIAGYICPPLSGNYKFYISGDDQCELRLSTSESPNNKVKIASVPDWSSFREWGKYPQQTSGDIYLNQGQKYFIEVLHKEGGGGDHVSVGWLLPDGLTEKPIQGDRLSPEKSILNPVPTFKSKVLCTENFNYPTGNLHGLSGGEGWASGWDAQRVTGSGYTIEKSNLLTYKTLRTNGNYAQGGADWFSVGRKLNCNIGNIFNDYLTNTLTNGTPSIGKNGTSIWLSFLLKKSSTSNEIIQVGLNSEWIPWVPNAPKISFGFYGNSCLNNGSKFWGIKIKNQVYRTNYPVTNDPVFVALNIEFGYTSKIKLFINPEKLGGKMINQPAAWEGQTMEDITFQSFYFNNEGGGIQNRSNLDEIRICTTYESVSPLASTYLINFNGSKIQQFSLFGDLEENNETYTVSKVYDSLNIFSMHLRMPSVGINPIVNIKFPASSKNKESTIKLIFNSDYTLQKSLLKLGNGEFENLSPSIFRLDTLTESIREFSFSTQKAISSKFYYSTNLSKGMLFQKSLLTEGLIWEYPKDKYELDKLIIYNKDNVLIKESTQAKWMGTDYNDLLVQDGVYKFELKVKSSTGLQSYRGQFIFKQ